VLGIAVVTAVFGAHGSLAGPAEVTSGFRWALATSAVVSALGATASLVLRPREVAR
jgi:hypothetical protein